MMEDPFVAGRAAMDQVEATMREFTPFLARITGAHTDALLKAGVPRKAVDVCVAQFHETMVNLIFAGVNRV